MTYRQRTANGISKTSKRGCLDKRGSPFYIFVATEKVVSLRLMIISGLRMLVKTDECANLKNKHLTSLCIVDTIIALLMNVEQLQREISRGKP